MGLRKIIFNNALLTKFISEVLEQRASTLARRYALEWSYAKIAIATSRDATFDIAAHF